MVRFSISALKRHSYFSELIIIPCSNARWKSNSFLKSSGSFFSVPLMISVCLPTQRCSSLIFRNSRLKKVLFLSHTGLFVQPVQMIGGPWERLGQLQLLGTSIGDKTEFGNCHIKYPLLMKCDYPKKKKSIISNGETVAIIKRKYKKIGSVGDVIMVGHLSLR